MSSSTVRLASQVHIKEIPPLKTVDITQEADFFHVITTPCRIEIRWDGSAFRPYDEGTSDDTKGVAPFERLWVRNPTLQTIFVEIYVGFTRYQPTRVAVMPPRTRLKGTAKTIPANSGVKFGGIFDGPDLRRKSIQVSNTDTTLPVELRDKDGNVCLHIFPQTSVVLEVSELVTVFNPNGADVKAYVSELIFTTKAEQ